MSARPSNPSRSLVELEKADRVLLEDQGTHVGLDRDRLEVGKPSLRCDHRIVGSKQQLILEDGIGVLHQYRRKVVRRPARQIDIDLWLVGSDRQRFILPGKGGMRED